MLQTRQLGTISHRAYFSNEILKSEITTAVSWLDSEENLSVNKTGETFLTFTSHTF